MPTHINRKVALLCGNFSGALECQFQRNLIRANWAKRHHLSIPNRCYTSERLTILKISSKYTDFMKTVKSVWITALRQNRRVKAWKANTRATMSGKWEAVLSNIWFGFDSRLRLHRALKLPITRAACLVGAHTQSPRSRAMLDTERVPKPTQKMQSLRGSQAKQIKRSCAAMFMQECVNI